MKNEEIIKLFKRDFSDAPNPVNYEIKNFNIQTPMSNMAIITCEMNIDTIILNHSVRFNNLRFSSFCVKNDNKWLMEHFHISFPTNLHGKGEAYPFKEIEEQTFVLQKLLSEKTNELNLALEKMKRLAITDRLTQIYNRIKIEECLDNEINRAQLYNYIFSVVIIDIDYFKKVNDQYGHMTGDKVLVEFTDLISKRIRKTDVFGRWGG